MPHIIQALLLAACLLFSSCIYDFYEEKEIDVPVLMSIQTKAGSEDDELKLETVRLLIFDESGVCTYNGFYSRNKLDRQGLYVFLNDELRLKGGEYEIYAILNENGDYSTLEDGSTLSSLVSSSSVTKDQVQQLLKWNGTSPRDEEPLFVMMAKKSQTITASALNTIRFDIDGTTAQRPMARIVVNSISASSGDLASNAKIFVKDMRLVNIPQSYCLDGSNSGSSLLTDSEMLSLSGLPLDANGFFSRNWSGEASATFCNWEIQDMEEDYRLYLTKDDKKDDKRLNANDWKMQYANESVSQSVADNIYTSTDTNNEFPKKTLERILTSLSDKDRDNASKDGNYGSSHYRIDQTSQKISLSEDAWSVEIGKSYYIPEHISADRDKCTALEITLCLAEPVLDISACLWGEMPSTWSYYSSETYLGLDKDNIAPELASMNSKAYVAQFVRTEDAGDGNRYVYVFIGDFSRKSLEQNFSASETASLPEGAILSWNPVKEITVRIPVNDRNYDSDYSVRRNTRYNVTLKVTDSTYDLFYDTKAGMSGSVSMVSETSIDRYE
ncbi:MAG: hypothetical protein ACI4A2_07895 [Candidatus Cryptobacteroides sp.]